MKCHGSVRSSAAASIVIITISSVLGCVLLAQGLRNPETWMFLASLIVLSIAHLLNLTREAGLPQTEISFELDSLAVAAADQSPAERLRDLNQLHSEGLLTDDEFLAKREQILAEL